jgi:hypothetical protein
MNYIMQGEGTVKFVMSFLASWDYDERMQMQRMSKQVTRATMEVTREKGSQRKAESWNRLKNTGIK